MEVVSESPAESAGLRAEDLIFQVQDTATEDVGDLQRLMVAEHIGRAVQVRVIRQGAVVDLELTPQELDG